MSAMLSLQFQTMYAQLVDIAHLGRLQSDFASTGNFVSRTIKGRRYWYFRTPMEGGNRRDRYVGPDSPELEERIRRHGEQKESRRERRTLVTGLQRAGLKGPDARTGAILEALEAAGIFRMRAVVVGTVAYQAYAGLLGAKLQDRNFMTQDLDVAQFDAISIAVGDAVATPFLDILRQVDPSADAIAETFEPTKAWRYRLGTYQVEILTPKRGPDGDALVHLPALKTDARPLRHLDFLIYREIPAVILHGLGIAVNVPAPERYCLHKLIVSQRRQATDAVSYAKSRKDLAQAQELMAALIQQKPHELRDAWDELQDRGPKWRERVAKGLAMIDPGVRSAFEGLVGPSGPT
ncbi:GSU2403 family nucleotidyltransferase fold protein [uncultured Alsobacter sp.]|uniref:nucleotidyltransferase family protein n=1 Tax=uncultured Alsobacter sp. TaxID=1748258 RepID=UPI0025F2C197|nr:GSU2403 family nucleotidyltransferase fold protein [uncultured Alsobacter sp.]